MDKKANFFFKKAIYANRAVLLHFYNQIFLKTQICKYFFQKNFFFVNHFSQAQNQRGWIVCLPLEASVTKGKSRAGGYGKW